MNDCIFCKIVDGDIPSIKLYEDEKAIVILDRFPSSIGHALVVSKEHFRDIEEVDLDTYAHMMKLAAKFAKRIKKATKCDGINILQNNGESAGQTIFHTHIHIIPRYKEDEINISWSTLDPSIEELIELKEKIN